MLDYCVKDYGYVKADCTYLFHSSILLFVKDYGYVKADCTQFWVFLKILVVKDYGYVKADCTCFSDTEPMTELRITAM